MNHITIIGNIAQDIEARTTQSGVAMTTLRVAVNRRHKNANGEREADFFTVVTWRQTAEFCAKYLSKGRKVAVEGSMQSRQYEAQDGSRRTVWELIADNVEALDKAPEGRTEAVKGNDGFVEVDEEDDLPFD